MGADQLRLGDEVALLDPHCFGFHLDIMDGHFVPNITFGPTVANAVDRASVHPSWVHLMVDNPSLCIDALQLKPHSIVSFHLETNVDHEMVIYNIKEKNYRPSLAINPKTPPEKLFDFLNRMVDHVLIMSVEPGFSGQKFLPAVLHKVAVLHDFRRKHGLPFTIGLDGGITAALIPSIKQHCVDQIAVSSAIFTEKDRLAALERLR